MKVLILYAAYGGGHASAAKSIKEYIEESYPEHTVSMVDSIKYVNQAFDKLTVDAYVKMSKSAPKLWGATYGNADKGALGKISSSTMKLMSIKLLGLIKSEQPDIIISTHPFTNQMCGRLKRKEKIDCIVSSVLTDFAPHSQWLVESDYIDYFFVAHDGMKEELILSNISSDKILVTGIPISLKFNEKYDSASTLRKLGLKNNKLTFLFFSGGEYGLGRNAKLFKSLVSSDLEFQMIAIAGRNEKVKRIFNKVVKANNREDSICILGFSDKVPELMHASDFVITKPGGITTSESLACALPMIIINPVPGQEDSNANFLLNNGVGIRLYRGENPIIAIESLINNSKRIEQIKEMASQVGKPNSTKDICDFLLNL